MAKQEPRQVKCCRCGTTQEVTKQDAFKNPLCVDDWHRMVDAMKRMGTKPGDWLK